MSEILTFEDYYKQYKNRPHIGITDKLKTANTYYIKKLLFYEMQVRSYNYSIDYSNIPNAIELGNTGNYYVVREDFVILLMKCGYIKMQQIAETYQLDAWDTRSSSVNFQRAEATADYVRLINGLIALRSEHNDIYELMVEGKAIEAYEKIEGILYGT